MAKKAAKATTNGNRLITVEEAVKAAAQHMQRLFPDAQDMRVEETELTEDDLHWAITLGFRIPEALNPFGRREYKLFVIDARTGVVRAMKIRSV